MSDGLHWWRKHARAGRAKSLEQGAGDAGAGDLPTAYCQLAPTGSAALGSFCRPPYIRGI